MNPLIRLVIDFARGEVGVREVGDSNRGRRVDEYQRADTLGGVGYPWCASFTSWLLKQAAAKVGRKIDYCYSASCDVVLAWARDEGVLRDTPQAGDFGLCMASHYDATHIFLVVEVDGNEVVTIEGNTNAGGSRNGNGVYKRRRKVTSKLKFVRWIDAQPKAVTAPAEKWTAKVGSKRLPLIKRGASFFAPSRDFGEALGYVVVWNPETQSVFYAGEEVPEQVIWVGGETYIGIRKLAEFTNREIAFDNVNNVLTVS